MQPLDFSTREASPKFRVACAQTPASTEPLRSGTPSRFRRRTSDFPIPQASVHSNRRQSPIARRPPRRPTWPFVQHKRLTGRYRHLCPPPRVRDDPPVCPVPASPCRGRREPVVKVRMPGTEPVEFKVPRVRTLFIVDPPGSLRGRTHPVGYVRGPAATADGPSGPGPTAAPFETARGALTSVRTSIGRNPRLGTTRPGGEVGVPIRGPVQSPAIP
jgi:hypothetical protein